MIKRLIIRWAISQLKKLNKKGVGYVTLEKYGVADIMKNEITGESMFIFD